VANLPTHKNPKTGEVLAGQVEVCPACYRNFSSTRAGDEHRATQDGKRVCLNPEEIGLELTVNSHGSLIYRTPSKAVGAGIRDEFSSTESYGKKELINTR
jgi:hypothetical protein